MTFYILITQLIATLPEYFAPVRPGVYTWKGAKNLSERLIKFLISISQLHSEVGQF